MLVMFARWNYAQVVNISILFTRILVVPYYLYTMAILRPSFWTMYWKRDRLLTERGLYAILENTSTLYTRASRIFPSVTYRNVYSTAEAAVDICDSVALNCCWFLSHTLRVLVSSHLTLEYVTQMLPLRGNSVNMYAPWSLANNERIRIKETI